MRTLGYMVLWIIVVGLTAMPGMYLCARYAGDDWFWPFAVSYMCGMVMWVVSTEMFERHDRGRNW